MKRSNRRQLSLLLATSTVILSLLASRYTAYEPVAETGDGHILTIITKPSLNTYYESKNGPDGMEFQLIQAFAEEHGYQLEVILAERSDDIYNALDQGLADIALIGRPMSISRRNTYLQSPAYMEATSQLVYKAGAEQPSSFNDLANKRIIVQDNEQNREKYRLLKAHYADIEWQFSTQSIDQLLSLVNKGKIDFTVVDSHTYLSKHSLYTQTRVAFDLYYPEPISLALSISSSPALKSSLNAYINTSKKNGTIAHYIERYYGHNNDADPLGSTSFAFLMHNRLPQYIDSIKQVAYEYKMDWRLLAAIAYQESHWDPEARSKTGVRGMMMLTHDTAMDMGVDDRIDVLQSLRGGAKYFQKMHKELPDSVKEPDRTWLALAAYNVGSGHLLDAFTITAFRDENPNLWSDVKRNLPLLAKKEWHEFTQYGHARGQEPVGYVQNIRHYHDILEWHFPPQYNEKKSPDSHLVVHALDDVIQKQRSTGSMGDNKLRVSGLFF